MALPELTENLNKIQSLPDKPTLDAEDLKKEFDASGNAIKEYVNETLLPALNTVITNLQNGNSSTASAVNSLQTIVNEATTNISNIQTTLSGLKSGATTKITIGSSVPTSLENGEIYFQYFN